ncbi:MAG TPA: DNA methyltransferase [Nocardioidaceae bacterium]|nr:DNA methyltransferase [Nocardioidaceae bacterium]
MKKLAELNEDGLVAIREAALSRTPVSIGPRRTASPHEYYRYPARFAPELAAAVISAFTDPGDLVGDYFLGGGTTLVEARMAGRISVGSDINSLSTFVSRVKTRLYSAAELTEVTNWAADASSASSKVIEWPADEQALSYFRNFSDAKYSEQRGVLIHALSKLRGVTSGRARDLARCVLLRTAQWGMDMRTEVPTPDELRAALLEDARTMVIAAAEATRMYRAADQLAASDGLPRALVLHQGLPGVSDLAAVARHPHPRLVLTSPPYPGVYVNYHRWKLRGRLETPLPYFIAGQSDGHGLAHYTMAARSDRTQNTYFERLGAAFSDVAKMCGRETTIVQVVGFNDLHDQLPRYLRVMERVGFTEFKLDELGTDDDGRLWRDVPGRRWWARAGDRGDVVQHTAREVVLFHRLAR